MGDKRISVRTLPSGERVFHHPPDAAHPEGKQVLIRGTSPLRERLHARHDEHRRRHHELHHAHTHRINHKRSAGAAKGLPSEKSPV